MLNHEPIWFDKKKEKSNLPKFSVFVGTPCHSEVSIHYTQSVLELQKYTAIILWIVMMIHINHYTLKQQS